MKRGILFFAVLYITVVWVFCDCKKNPVEPSFDIRQLTWTTDTLQFEKEDNQTIMKSIWGSSANDVYVVGHNSSGGGKMYHFNGKQWRDVKLSSIYGGPIDGAHDLSDIYGITANNIWAVGERNLPNPNPPPSYFKDISLVIHYDGSQWHDIPVPKGERLFSVWGSSEDNIWMGGLEGTFFHYDGISVKEVSFPVEIDTTGNKVQYVAQITGISVDKAYMLFYELNENFNARRYLLSLQNNTWTVLDNSLFYEGRKIWLSPNGTLYAYGMGQVFKKNSNSWIEITSGKLDLDLGDIYGPDDSNFYIVGSQNADVDLGQAYHYNGSDWFEIKDTHLINLGYCEAFIIDDEVFLLGVTFETAAKTIMLHGK